MRGSTVNWFKSHPFFLIRFRILIVAEADQSSDGGDNGSDSDWTPDFEDDKHENMSEAKKEKVSPNHGNTTRTLYKRPVVEYNIQATYFKGKKGSALLRDPEGNEFCKDTRTSSARGNLIYWKCRASAARNLGCKMRAVTNGFILETVSGEHSEKGVIVEKHIKEPTKRPRYRKSLNSRESRWQTGKKITMFNIKANFSKGKHGGTMLTTPDGFEWCRTQIVKNHNYDNQTLCYWDCRTHRDYGCKITAVTIGDMLEKTLGEHDHSKKVLKLDTGDDKRLKTHKDYWRRKKDYWESKTSDKSDALGDN